MSLGDSLLSSNREVSAETPDVGKKTTQIIQIIVCIHAWLDGGTHTCNHGEGREIAVSDESRVFNHPCCVCLAVVRFSLVNLPNAIAKLLLLDSRENSQTVLIPLAGKRDGLFPEQSKIGRAHV